MSEEWAPCRHIDYGEDMGDPRYGVMFDDFGPTEEHLTAKGLMGGGYTWEGIVKSMIHTRYPNYESDISYDPEGSMFCARSSNLESLRCVVACIRQATASSAVLDEAIENADHSSIE